MHFTTTSALSALALVSFVSAVPLDKRNLNYGNRGDYASAWAQYGGAAAPSASPSGVPAPPPGGINPAPTPSPSYSPSGPGTPSPPSSSIAPPPPSGSGSAGAVTFPLANGFPNIQNPSSALSAIQAQAHGTLSNGAPPPSLNPDDLTSLRLIAFNELFEVFFFTELLHNVTTSAPGYAFQDEGLKQEVISALTAVVAQEELHTLNANGALAKFNAGPIQACKYQSPVSDFKSAIALASTFTDVVLGTLQDVIVKMGLNGDAAAARGVASSLGQEGEQNGFYRHLLGKIPSALPFLTASSREFAFSALNQNFVVPGSCPNSNTISLPIFKPLTVVTQNIQAADQTLQFSIADGSVSGLSLVYINQQNKPVVQPISGSGTTFSAPFPFSSTLMNGLTIAAVTNSAGPFANVNEVAKATVYGPGLIEIN